MVDEVKKPKDKAQSAPIVGTDGASLMGEIQPPNHQATAADAAPDLSREAWEKSYKPMAWNETSAGRLAIRSVSRGVLGAVFFTAGGRWARKMMRYENEYNREMKFSDLLKQTHEDGRHNGSYMNPFHAVTKVLDTVLSIPIESAVTLATGDAMMGRRAVHFKPTKYFSDYKDGRMLGRSLGAEMMFVTFDFFMMSIGDAMGRDVIGWFDPAQKKEWLDEKGHVKWPEAIKTLSNSMFRYVTYNGGEDWAVALPYVYYMKGQSHLIDKHLTPGYHYESDITLNASSLKMQTKSNPHLVNGSYSLEAIMDYQGRFTFYNIGTLMFREAYDKLEHLYHGKNINLYGAQDEVKNKPGILAYPLEGLKWTIRSFVKGGLYMTPIIPLFSMTRATQSRENALFIDSNTNAAIGFIGSDNQPHYLQAKHRKLDGTMDGVTANTPVYYARYNSQGNGGRGSIDPITPNLSPKMANPLVQPGFDEYARRNNMVENAFSWIGSTTQRLSHSFDHGAAKLDRSGMAKPLRFALGLKPNESITGFAQSTVKASISYTPYMYGKAEMAILWDNGKTDMALERAIDGAFKGDWKEFKAGVGETWNALLYKPFDDPAREREAKRRIAIDTSAADDADPEYWQRHHDNAPAASRMVFDARTDFESAINKVVKEQGMRPKAPVAERAAGVPWQDRVLRGAQDPNAPETTKHAPQSHAAREEMRKFLEEVQPPTNSVH